MAQLSFSDFEKNLQRQDMRDRWIACRGKKQQRGDMDGGTWNH